MDTNERHVIEQWMHKRGIEMLEPRRTKTWDAYSHFYPPFEWQRWQCIFTRGPYRLTVAWFTKDVTSAVDPRLDPAEIFGTVLDQASLARLTAYTEWLDMHGLHVSEESEAAYRLNRDIAGQLEAFLASDDATGVLLKGSHFIL